MPVIWLIDAYRAGERGQVRALADALSSSLAWPCETKVLNYRSAVFWPHVLGSASLAGITAESSETLTPPWPDIVVSCGVRNEPICRWIREQSGGKTRYVHVGRPWAALESFDLVITTGQYRVPEHPNVLHNTLTLHSLTPKRLDEARIHWAKAFAELPRPHFTVIVGGDSGPYTLGPKAAARLGREASQVARARGGSLLVTTSSRTDKRAIETLYRAIDVPNYFYRWQPQDPANPYVGMLASADRLIVTGDSIAMLSEACATGKPVAMFDIGGMREREGGSDVDFRVGASLYQWMMKFLPDRLSRDITLVHRQLREASFAIWSDEGLVSAIVPGETDLERAVSAVRQLLGEV